MTTSPAIAFDHVTTFVDGPAGRIAVVDHGGEGPDVLLLHGANRTLLDWEPVRPHLPGLRLVAMDLRGHGRSDPPADDDYDWAGHFADVDAVLAAFDLRAPYLVGHSLGGTVAVRYAAAYGAAGVVDLDGFGGGVPSLYPGLSAAEVKRRRADQLAMYRQPAVGDRVDAAGAGALVTQARALADAFGWDRELAEAGARRAQVPDGDGRFALRPALRVLPALMAPLEGWDMFAELRSLTTPALVVQGGRIPPLDQLPAEQRELTEALFSGISREIDALRVADGPVAAVRLDDAAHMVHLDAPHAVAALVRDFIGLGRGPE
ncbi:MAG TPA: alpha/beta hydrolase [Pseudonocardiaceae bacterium]